MTKTLLKTAELHRFRRRILKLNNARRGSFGEFVFAHTVLQVLGLDVKRFHRKGADFIVDNWGRVDVKTSFRWIAAEPTSLRPYSGERRSKTRYARVEMFISGPRVSIETQVVNNLTWTDLYDLWIMWSRDRSDELIPPKPHTPDKRWVVMKRRIESFFMSRGLKAKVIQRTTQQRFGRRGPENLWPKQREDVVVFVDFYDDSYNRIRRVYALPARLANQIPRIPWARGRAKGSQSKTPDLVGVPAKFIFENLQELKGHYFERFALKRS